MSISPALRLGLGDVARLAGVRRPVASMWRRRFADADDPFPGAMTREAGQPLFDALEVAQWLQRTEHGNNPEAVADVAASATPQGFDFADVSHIDAVAALLTLRAVDGEPFSGPRPQVLTARAIAADPHDEYLVSEIARARPEPSEWAAWAEWADALADAAFSPSGAIRVLARRHAATQSAAGSRGPLSHATNELLLTLAGALCTEAAPAVHFGAGVSGSFAIEVLRQLRHDPDVSVSTTSAGRRIRRNIIAHGFANPTANPTASNTGPRVSIDRFPCASAATPPEILQEIDELVLSMRADDRALILAPSSLLTDVTIPHDRARSDILRSGRVRAIVRLGDGLVTSAPREAFALWVLGPPVGEVAIADRFTAIANLTDVALTPAARADLTSDVIAAMGSARAVRAHAFRFARLARTASLLAARGSLVDAAAPPTPQSLSLPAATPAAARKSRARRTQPHELPALIDQARDHLGIDAPSRLPVAASTQALPAAPIEALLQERHLRALPGTRVEAHEFRATGLVAVTAEDLDDPTQIGRTHVDPLEFAARHPSARLTAPGDIIFRTAPTPRAWVDAEGSSVVVAPARVLRVNAADPGGLVPELVAADIAQARGGAGAWRRWALRRVAPAHAASLAAALTEMTEQRAALQRRIDALDTYSALLTAGVVAGTVKLSDPTAAQASTP